MTKMGRANVVYAHRVAGSPINCWNLLGYIVDYVYNQRLN
jgi:hypothetical protein